MRVYMFGVVRDNGNHARRVDKIVRGSLMMGRRNRNWSSARFRVRVVSVNFGCEETPIQVFG